MLAASAATMEAVEIRNKLKFYEVQMISGLLSRILSRPALRRGDHARGSFLTGICSISKVGTSGSGAIVDVTLGATDRSVRALIRGGLTVSVIEAESSLIEDSLIVIAMS